MRFSPPLYRTESDVAVGVDSRANQAQLFLQVIRRGLEGIGFDRERRPKDNQGRAILGRTNRLFDRKTTYGLNGYLDCGDHLSQLVQRTRRRFPGGEESAPLVITDVMDDKIAAEFLQPAGSINLTSLSGRRGSLGKRPAWLYMDRRIPT